MSRKKKTIDIKKVEKLAAQGLTKDQIILCLDVGSSTFYRNQAESGELGVAYDRGRAKGVLLATNTLINHHIKKLKSIEAIKFYLKTQGDWKEKTETTHKGDAENPVQVKTTITALNLPALTAEADEVLKLARQRKEASESGNAG